jgi:hypothetical protein
MAVPASRRVAGEYLPMICTALQERTCCWKQNRGSFTADEGDTELSANAVIDKTRLHLHPDPRPCGGLMLVLST